MIKIRKTTQMKNNKFLLLALGLFAFATPAQADDRDITEAEIEQVLENILLMESSIINTNDVELEDKQREEISKEIVSHYTDDAVIKFYEVRMTEKLKRLPILQGKYDKYAYENILEVENKLRNLNGSFDVKNIEFMGQQALVDVNIIYTFQYNATGYEDNIKISADILTKSACKMHMRIDYDDRPRISNENCKSRSYISNIDIKVPEYIEDSFGMAVVKLDQDVVFKR